MPARILALVVALLVVGCGARAKPVAAWPDAPVVLRDDGDRDQAIDELWVMAPGAARDAKRAAIAAAISRRITDAIEEDRPFDAATLLDQLTWIFQTEPQAIARGLAPHTETLLRLRAMFAKSGALEPTVQTLVVLAEVEPARRTEHLAELDEVLAFADELAIAENGALAVRGQPIALLQPTALALPLRWLVDRYVTLSVERQRVIGAVIDKEGASMQIVRAHHDVLSTSRRIANVLARAGRTAEIHASLAKLSGLGADRELTARSEVVAEQPTVDAFLALAKILRNEEGKEPVAVLSDPAAALGVCLDGLSKFPTDPDLLAAAGGDARTLGRIDQAIALYEQALRGTDEVDTILALRLGKLYGDRIARLASSGRPRAAHVAWRGVLAFTSTEARSSPHMVWQQAAAIAESALGRGLATQGLVADAKRALTASLERAPSIDAYETLTTIELQTDRYAAATQWAEAGMSLLGEEGAGDRWRRAKLQRLVGDGLRRAGRPREAAARYLDAMRSWASLGETKDLPRAIAAERALDYGRMLWWLGALTADGPMTQENIGRSVDSTLDAVELDPSNAEIVSGAVVFLLEAGRYREAVDAYYSGLGAELSDVTKVYMSLWIVGDARRRGEPVDRLASEYLASRRGDTWYEMLARTASGRMPFAALAAAATTGPRKAELAFYGAVLGFHPEAATPEGARLLLAQVIRHQVVLDAEYDLARLYLKR